MRTCSCKNLHMNVHSSIIYSSHKVETTEMSIKGWANKMWHSHLIGMLMIKKEWNTDSPRNRDKLWRHHAKGKEARHQGPHIVCLHLCECPTTDSPRQISKQPALTHSGKDEGHWLLIPWGVFLKVQKCFKVQLWRQWHTSRDILRKYS